MPQPPPSEGRRVQCLQHVRALNSQFKSWLDKEWSLRPECLWSGGVVDYLTHASSILKEYSDVVDWMTAQEAKGKGQANGVPAEPSSAPQSRKRGSDDVDQSGQGRTKAVGFGLSGTAGQAGATTPGTASFKPFGAFGGSSGAGTAPALVGGLAGTPAAGWSWTLSAPTTTAFGALGKGDAGAGAGQQGAEDEEEGEVQEEPESPSVQRQEEKGVKVLYEGKAKLWIQEKKEGTGGEWKARGVGAVVVKLLGGAEGEGGGEGEGDAAHSRKVAIFRNEAGKVLLNASLPKGGMKAVQNKNALTTTLFCLPDPEGAEGGNSDALRPTTVLFRLGKEAEALALKNAMES